MVSAPRVVTPVSRTVTVSSPRAITSNGVWLSWIGLGTWMRMSIGRRCFGVAATVGLATGSLPAALVTVVLLGVLGTGQVRSGVILHALGVALLLTALGLLLRRRLREIGRVLRTDTPVIFKQWQPGLTVIAGAVVGCLVSLTSVGAGALGTVAMAYLYPYRLTPAKLVGTDLAHAIPLALVAGAGHLVLGNIDLGLLANLLLGSIPGILIGSALSTRAPEALVRNAIATVLLIVAGKLLY